MTEKPTDEAETLSRKARRMEKARQRKARSAWLGLGMFGMVGWAIAVPTIGGVVLGLYLDARWPGDMSWTLALLLAGVALGCVNAWYWVQREGRGDE